MNKNIKVHIGELLPDVRLFPILNRHFGKAPYAGKKAYRAIFDEMDFSFLELVDRPEDADFLLVPHNYFSIKNNTEYINAFIAHAEKYRKRIIMFAFGDSDEDIVVPHAFLFRYAGYRYKGVRKNEVIMPTQIYAGDILRDEFFSLRDKTEIPTVSFCGWGDLGSLREKASYALRLLPWDIRRYLFFDAHAEVHKQGIYWRKKAIKALSKSQRVRTSFLVRNFYTANKNTVQGDPAELRREYIQNILRSDFVLTPRGDANMAVRFYETLALGRIPVVIDTEWVLPLENVIDYKKFVVFVPYADVKNADAYIRAFWDNMTNEDFHDRQRLARETFMKYLKFDSFLRHILPRLPNGGVSSI